MRWFVAGLYLVAGLLLLAALVTTGFRVRNEHRKLATKLNEIDRIIGDSSLSDTEQAEQMGNVLEPRFNFGRMTYTYEWIQRLILHDALTELRTVAGLTFLGVVCGTIASVLSLWLPPS